MEKKDVTKSDGKAREGNASYPTSTYCHFERSEKPAFVWAPQKQQVPPSCATLGRSE